MQVRTFNNAGFTLIEMIVSLALFSTVATISAGSLLVLVDNNSELRGEQSTISNLSYALDAMSRDLRSGFDYHCASYTSDDPFINQNSLTVNRNCPDGTPDEDDIKHGVSFRDGGSAISGSLTRKAYYYDREANTIMRRIGDGPAESIIASEISIVDASFTVTGSGRQWQPSVTVWLDVETEDGFSYVVQTTVDQRLLDFRLAD